MKRAVFIVIVLIFSIVFLSLSGQNFTYVGASKCQICHKTEKQGMQFSIWQKTKHSSSYANLSSEKALALVKEIGLEIPPAESEKCLKCHSPLFDKAAEIKQEGVTCEVCHGPGSEYKKLNIMKNREEAVKNGLLVYESQEAIKAHCLTCHEKAHGKTFDFASSWEKIKHPLPEKQ